MKTKSWCLIAIIACAAQFAAGQNFRVEATNDDISYYLDLKAVASVFGDAYNLEDFERRLNDYDNRISNLDLNNDGMIDYLRVIEKPERNMNIVVVQAVLDRDIFQDVATIVTEQNRYSNSYVQIIGAPFIYGANYIIEPRYYRTPRILTWFHSPYYRTWYSPYYWGYYPNYYRYRRPLSISLYVSWTDRHINHDHYYGYSTRWRNSNAQRTYYGMSRNDFGNRYPERSFTKRNVNSNNRYDMDRSREQSGYNSNNRPSGGTMNRYENNSSSERRSDNGRRNDESSSNRGQNNNSSSTTPTNNREYNSDRNTSRPANNDTYRNNNDSRQSSDRSSRMNSSDNQSRSENKSSAGRGSERSSNSNRSSSSGHESGGRR